MLDTRYSNSGIKTGCTWTCHEFLLLLLVSAFYQLVLKQALHPTTCIQACVSRIAVAQAEAPNQKSAQMELLLCSTERQRQGNQTHLCHFVPSFLEAYIIVWVYLKTECKTQCWGSLEEGAHIEGWVMRKAFPEELGGHCLVGCGAVSFLSQVQGWTNRSPAKSSPRLLPCWIQSSLGLRRSCSLLSQNFNSSSF